MACVDCKSPKRCDDQGFCQWRVFCLGYEFGDNRDPTPQDVAAPTLEQLAKDAAIGRVVWRFIDRMEDVAECDPAEKILQDFLVAVRPAIADALNSVIIATPPCK